MNNPRTFLEPLAGYVLDLLARLQDRPFVPHSLTKLQNLKLCRDLTGARTAIEIGSFIGVTARRLSFHFERVISVEIDRNLHDQAKARCADRRNVELLLGDGPAVLGNIAQRVDRAVLFLDGHYSGGATGIGSEPEPVLAELDAIADHLANICAVAIDDFRLFGVEGGWPRKSEVMEKLEATFPSSDWQIIVHNDQFLVIRR